MKKILLTFAIIGCLSFVLSSNAQTPKPQDQITEKKITFLLKFFDYVTWPEGKKIKDNATFCLSSKSTLKEKIQNIAQSQFPNLTLKVMQKSEAGLEECHIFYLEDHDEAFIESIPHKRGVLSITDKDHINNTVVALNVQNKNIKILIHKSNAQKQGLKISAKLLNIAEVQDEY